MEPEEERITGALHECAALAGPLELRADDLARASRRRVRRRRAAITMAATLTVCAAVGTAVAVDGGTSGNERAASAPADIVRGPLTFECGKPLPVRPVSALPGTSLRVTGVRYDFPRIKAPLVTFDLNFTSEAVHRMGHIGPEVLVMRDGIVVGGPIARSMQPNMPRSPDSLGWTNYPPTRLNPQQGPDWLCGTLTWSEIRANPGQYRLAAVMTAYGEADQPLPPDSPLLLVETGVEER